MKTFWDGTKRLLPSCFSLLRNLRSKNVSDNKVLKSLSEVLDILAKLKTLEARVTVELFPSTVYGWIDNSNSDSEPLNIDKVLVQAINTGAKEWFEYVIEGSKQTKTNESDEDKLQYVIMIIQMVRSDLQRAMEYFDKLFYQ